MKKLLSLIVTLTMVIGVFCVPASAEEASISSDVPTYEVLATMDAQLAEPELREYLAENGIEVHAGHILTAVSVDSGNQDEVLALQIGKKQNDSYTIHSLIELDESGKEVNAPISVVPPTSRSISSITWNPNDLWGTGAITMDVSVNYYWDVIETDNPLLPRAFLYPTKVTFSYKYRNASNKPKVDYMTAQVDLDRIKCDSRYTRIDYDYSVTICSRTVNNPTENQACQASGSVPTGIHVEIQDGYHNSSMYVILRASVNGKEDGATRPMIPVEP